MNNGLTSLPGVWPIYRKTSLAGKRESTQYKTAKLNQPIRNMIAPLHRDKASEIVVNTID